MGIFDKKLTTGDIALGMLVGQKLDKWANDARKPYEEEIARFGKNFVESAMAQAEKKKKEMGAKKYEEYQKKFLAEGYARVAKRKALEFKKKWYE